jgi:hypothetical protein
MMQPSLLDKKISPAEKINPLVQLRMDEFNPWFRNDDALLKMRSVWPVPSGFRPLFPPDVAEKP